MTYLLVGLGGAFGSMTRFGLGLWITKKAKSIFPWGTMLINISGALFLGIVSGIGLTGNLYPWYLLLGEGFFGAYTTFSTFMYEGFKLFQYHEKLNAFIYVLGSIVIGVLGFSIGYYLTLNLH